jgi:hypothetical protein
MWYDESELDYLDMRRDRLEQPWKCLSALVETVDST